MSEKRCSVDLKKLKALVDDYDAVDTMLIGLLKPGEPLGPRPVGPGSIADSRVDLLNAAFIVGLNGHTCEVVHTAVSTDGATGTVTVSAEVVAKALADVPFNSELSLAMLRGPMSPEELKHRLGQALPSLLRGLLYPSDEKVWFDDEGREWLSNLYTRSDEDQRAWWSGLSFDQQVFVLETAPRELMLMTGLPPVVRHDARNRYMDALRSEIVRSESTLKAEVELAATVKFKIFDVGGEVGGELEVARTYYDDNSVEVTLSMSGKGAATLGFEDAAVKTGLRGTVEQVYRFATEAEAEAFLAKLVDSATPSAGEVVGITTEASGRYVTSNLEDLAKVHRDPLDLMNPLDNLGAAVEAHPMSDVLDQHAGKREHYTVTVASFNELELDTDAGQQAWFDGSIAGEAGVTYDLETKDLTFHYTTGGEATAQALAPAFGVNVGSPLNSTGLAGVGEAEVTLSVTVNNGELTGFSANGTAKIEGGVAAGKGVGNGGVSGHAVAHWTNGGRVGFEADYDLRDPHTRQIIENFVNGDHGSGLGDVIDQSEMRLYAGRSETIGVEAQADIEFAGAEFKAERTGYKNDAIYVKPKGGDLTRYSNPS